MKHLLQTTIQQLSDSEDLAILAVVCDGRTERLTDGQVSRGYLLFQRLRLHAISNALNEFNVSNETVKGLKSETYQEGLKILGISIKQALFISGMQKHTDTEHNGQKHYNINNETEKIS